MTPPDDSVSTEKIAIVGSREFPDETLVREYVAGLEPHAVTIISGGARGVDSWAEDEAESWSIPTDIYPADWDEHGKAAGFIRNQMMVEEADAVVAFWDGESNGTRHSIKLAMDAGKPLDIYVRREAND